MIKLFSSNISKIIILTLLSSPIISFGAKPDFKNSKTSPKIVCTEYALNDDGESIDVGKISIDLNTDDSVKKIAVSRIKFDGKEAIDLVFTPENSENLVHQVELNDIEDYDAETNQTIYKWNIKDIEVIKATRKDGKKIRIKINDHHYVGHPGSSITFVVTPGKSFEASSGGEAGVSCEGPLKFPGETRLEEETL